MKNTIIACRMIHDELQQAMDEINSQDPVIWVDSGYHSEPERLKAKLQEIIDGLEGTDNIILVYGYCGNALLGLKATTANLIFPRVNDCISMLLKSERLKDAYYLTRRWIESPASIVQEYKIALERYGEERTKKLFRLMLKNYTKFMLLETSTYDTEKYLKEIQEFAEKIGLNVDSQEGDLQFLKKILTGPYDEKNFVIIKKGEKVDLSHIVNGDERKAANF
ncbi:hypothetical protein AN618_21030 [Fervidicola ferrireducens]|uniref:DUF1638 domain-containing protein n=1 Tax=Fervidicola ferrireducens TaxID=520764 RepID=A0A140L353_9FIRM|nr:DUF1638 domain-containing protein [Fervidicola ferrireducens]KXG74978.1 hypothetical protein AN618_21030 [Fervidicola ferrireducens]